MPGDTSPVYTTPVPGGIQVSVRSLTPGTLMEFLILDASRIPSAYTGLPGPIFACHNYNDYGAEPLLWQGVQYQPFPVQVQGYQTSTEQQQSRPTITVGNLGAVAYSGGVFSALMREFDDLVGAVVIRKRTFLRFLDAQPALTPYPFADEVHAPDPTQEFPDEVFYIDRKLSETKTTVQFELTTAADLEGVQLPRRQLCANQCPWIYRSGVGCDYAGPPVADQYNNPLVAGNNRGEWDAATNYAPGDAVFLVVGPGANVYTSAGDSIFSSDGNTREYFVCIAASPAGKYPPQRTDLWTADICAKTLTACKLRFGAQADLPFGGFPAIAQAPQASKSGS